MGQARQHKIKNGCDQKECSGTAETRKQRTWRNKSCYQPDSSICWWSAERHRRWPADAPASQCAPAAHLRWPGAGPASPPASGSWSAGSGCPAPPGHRTQARSQEGSYWPQRHFCLQMKENKRQSGGVPGSRTVEETPPSLMVSTVVPGSSTPAFFSGGAEGPGSPAVRLLPAPDMVAKAYRFPPSTTSSWTLKNAIKEMPNTHPRSQLDLGFLTCWPIMVTGCPKQSR